MKTAPEPTVSVVTATYNRSNVLRYAIKTVLWQTVQEWELWVIGDACTDDTEEVVRSFDDPRIHFFNLPENFGEQSKPNNEGVRRAKGKYIAFLNHDDLWLPDHLEKCIERIEESGADLVFSLYEDYLPGGTGKVQLTSPSGRFDPSYSSRASSWVLRRELAEEIGPWRSYRECYTAPSYDWLLQAWRAGKKLYLVPWMTVLSITSAGRPGCYANRDAHEQELLYKRLCEESNFRERELTSLLIRATNAQESLRMSRILGALVRKLLRPVSSFGVSPRQILAFFRNRRKGGLIDQLRKSRGLPALKR